MRFQLLESDDVDAEPVRQEVALDVRRTWVNPVRRELAERRLLVQPQHERGFPWFSACSMAMPCRWARLRRTAWPAQRSTRPLRCSKSAGFAGVFQCTTAEHHQWNRYLLAPRSCWPARTARRGYCKPGEPVAGAHRPAGRRCNFPSGGRSVRLISLSGTAGYRLRVGTQVVSLARSAR